MDRLCMVLADHLETNMQRPNQAVESAGQLPINQEVLNHLQVLRTNVSIYLN